MSANIFADLKNVVEEKMTEKKLANAIKAKYYDLAKLNPKRNTPLMVALASDLEEASLAIIKTGESTPEQVNKDGDTALIVALNMRFNDLADEIIKTGKSKPDQVNNDGKTALMLSVSLSLPSAISLALIATGHSKPDHVDNDGNTALILALDRRSEIVALELIRSGQSKPDQVANDGTTALIWAFNSAFNNAALALIATGNSKPDQVANDGDRKTALLLSINKRVEPASLALIATGNSLPFYPDSDGNTPLMLACLNGLENIAVALIETGESNTKHTNKYRQTALALASRNGLKKVIALLNAKSGIVIDVNQSGFNTITQETKIIKDYLSEDDSNNIAIKFAENYFLTTRSDIDTQLSNNAYIKYACKTAGEDEEGSFWDDPNILSDLRYFSLSAILGIQGVVFESEIKDIVVNLSTNLYEILPMSKKLVSIISEDFLNGSAGEGADHCQSGKETDVYKIIEAERFVNLKRGRDAAAVAAEESKAQPVVKKQRGRRATAVAAEESKEETTLIESKEDDNPPIINIMYKGTNYACPINDSTTIGELKTFLLSMLISKHIIDSDRFNVKFVYNGQVVTRDDILLITLNSRTGKMIGETMQAMLSPMTGGKRRKNKKSKKTKKYNRKTRKIRK
jgi:ankyrin repeat protein